ncbi:hypothetical protein GDO81_022285 [Engystomops pustulosus]|uniref:exodeoxyribonuclease III n=1 Tax=Engystomops pustulosus TaxID=76066 RepID=A0AAV6YUJ6_ENGPU|nr:hypothetical protein GDO81_022285 [Engystomops pustulosus]
MARLLNVHSWNVQGLGEANKRYAVMRALKAIPDFIICLQETHMTTETVHLLNRSWIGMAYHSYFTASSRGVSVLIHKNVPFRCSRTLIDSEGRFVCLAGTIYQTDICIAAIYVPPSYNAGIIKTVLSFVMTDPNVPVLLIGDYNLVTGTP